MSERPRIVECFVFRVAAGGEVEILLLRRAPHRSFPGLWQCVTGRVEPDERVPMAVLREVHEETGLGGGDVLGFYDLDQIVTLYDEGADGTLLSAIYAVRVRPGAEPRTSPEEHDAMRWAPAHEVPVAAVWPPYAESVRRVTELLTDPDRERWFRLDGDGRRTARHPAA